MVSPGTLPRANTADIPRRLTTAQPAALPETGGSPLPWTSIVLLVAGLLALGLGLTLLAGHMLWRTQQ